MDDKKNTGEKYFFKHNYKTYLATNKYNIKAGITYLSVPPDIKYSQNKLSNQPKISGI